MEETMQANERHIHKGCKRCQGCSGCTGGSGQNCGTLDTGCPQSAVSYIDDSMCNGVFAPVCAPEVCNVPRIPHHEILVEGQGIILDAESGEQMAFIILVEREMQVYRGKLIIAGNKGNMGIINASMLKYFEGDGENHVLALFHEMNPDRNIMLTIQQKHMEMPAQIYVYSSPLEANPLKLGGEVVSGEVKIYEDHNVHEH